MRKKMVSNKEYFNSVFYAAILWAFCLSFFEMLKMSVSTSTSWLSFIDIILIIGGLFSSYAIIWYVFLLLFAFIFIKYLKKKWLSHKNGTVFFWCIAFFSYEMLLILIRLNSDRMYVTLYGTCSLIISIACAALIAYGLFHLLCKLIQVGKLDQIGLRSTSIGISLVAYAMTLMIIKAVSDKNDVNLIFSIILLIVYLLVSKFVFLILNKLKQTFRRPNSKIIIKNVMISIFIFALSIVAISVISKTEETGPSSKPNVILISLDTVRVDHLSCYKLNSRKTSPNIDKIAQNSYLFKNAYSTTSWTLPAHASMMTGLFPSTHKADRSINQIARNPVDPLPLSHTTLAEMLRDNGYVTVGIISVPYLTKVFGLDRGFQFYFDRLDPFENLPFIYKNEHAILVNLLMFSKIIEENDSDGQKRASEVNEEAISWLDKNRDNPKPFFMFLHYFDAHYVYDPPAPYNIREDGTTLDYFYDIETLNKGKYSLSTSGINDLISAYDGEIRYMDYYLGELFEKLKQLNILDNTLLIITSDHGECFNEHEIWTHGNTLYQEQIHVPMIVHYPELIQSGHIDSDNIVQLVDLMPTILEISQVPVPENLQGRSLLPVFQGKPDLDYSLAFMELRPDISWKGKNPRFGNGIKAVIHNEWKYILTDNGVEELYKINSDPYELNNLALNEIKRAEEMRSILQIWEKSVTQDNITESDKLDSGTLKQLRSLGYIK